MGHLLSECGVQLSLDDELAEQGDFGEWVESLPAEIREAVGDPRCTSFVDEECRWTPSCAKEGCWRAECENTGQPLQGIGPRAA
jgi:hypothetical protein